MSGDPGDKEDIPGATDGRGHYGPVQHEIKAYSFEGKDHMHDEKTE